jgi:hypothetical protein
MSVNPSPIAGFAGQFFDNNGIILSGGKIFTYAAGTTTPQASYTSATGVTPHTNPIVLDSAGRVPGGEIWLTDSLIYKFVIETSTNVLIGTFDNVAGINDFSGLTPLVFNATSNGTALSYSLLKTPTNKNTTSVYINGVYQQKNTYSLSSLTLTFSEAPPVNASIEIIYF